MKSLRVKDLLRRSTWLRAAYRKARAEAFARCSVVSPALLCRIRYREAWGRWPDLERPSTFDEKLLWLNLYWRHPLKAECGDKYGVRGYAESLRLGHLLPGLHGVFESVDEIDFESLPERFVLKCTHGCKNNVFCTDRAVFDEDRARQALAQGMAKDYSKMYGELHYRSMTRRIICEDFLGEPEGGLPIDYKFYCFNGQPRWVLCCYDRVPNGLARLAVFDLAWNPVVFYRGESGEKAPVSPPEALREMLDACLVLAEPFPFVRVDFYCVRGQALLGELTFTPDACVDATYTVSAQQELGRALRLPERLSEGPHGRLVGSCGQRNRHPSV